MCLRGARVPACTFTHECVCVCWIVIVSPCVSDRAIWQRAHGGEANADLMSRRAGRPDWEVCRHSNVWRWARVALRDWGGDWAAVDGEPPRLHLPTSSPLPPATFTSPTKTTPLVDVWLLASSPTIPQWEYCSSIPQVSVTVLSVHTYILLMHVGIKAEMTDYIAGGLPRWTISVFTGGGGDGCYITWCHFFFFPETIFPSRWLSKCTLSVHMHCLQQSRRCADLTGDWCVFDHSSSPSTLLLRPAGGPCCSEVGAMLRTCVVRLC